MAELIGDSLMSTEDPRVTRYREQLPVWTAFEDYANELKVNDLIGATGEQLSTPLEQWPVDGYGQPYSPVRKITTASVDFGPVSRDEKHKAGAQRIVNELA